MVLPSGYKKLEYIESTGAQYIDTGVKPGPYVFTFDFSFLKNGKINLMGHTANAGWYFGCYENGDYDGGSADARINLSAYSRRTIRVESSSGLANSTQTLSVDGITVTSHRNVSVSQNLSIFKISGSNYWAPGRLYSAPCTIEINGELVRNFVPCKNQSGDVGLYDLVGKRFYGNAGAGSFTAGPELVPPADPAGAKQLLAVVLAWNAVACDGYRIYKKGSLLAEVTATQYTDTAVQDGETVRYEVAAFRGDLESSRVPVEAYVREGYAAVIPLVETAFFP